MPRNKSTVKFTIPLKKGRSIKMTDAIQIKIRTLQNRKTSYFEISRKINEIFDITLLIGRVCEIKHKFLFNFKPISENFRKVNFDRKILSKS
jgi:hypothetical protein